MEKVIINYLENENCFLVLQMDSDFRIIEEFKVTINETLDISVLELLKSKNVQCYDS